MQSTPHFPTDELIKIRQHLHAHPELSGQEAQTAAFVLQKLQALQPRQIIHPIGKHGIAAVFEGAKPGPAILFRAELDALPVHETNTFAYRSVSDNVGHKCGHDGHATLFLGLAYFLAENPPPAGRVVLCFQSAEETGQGAAWYVNDPQYVQLQPDYAFALHNLPGLPAGTIVTSDAGFASASTGFVATLKSKTAHAAEPHNGINPGCAVAEMIHMLDALPREGQFEDFTLSTLVNVRLGEEAFGTSAGHAVVMATLRAYRNTDMDRLMGQAAERARNIAQKHKLGLQVEWKEYFPATRNAPGANKQVQQAAQKLGYPVQALENPFRWSEDFAHFLKGAQGAMFGLGAGISMPQLHNPDYDFPDEQLETGTRMFYQIMQQLLDL